LASGQNGRVDLGLRDRVYLVTGGSRGLGFAAAQALVADGARVLLSGPNESTAAAAAARLTQDAVLGSGPDRPLLVMLRAALWANFEDCYLLGQRRIRGDNLINRLKAADTSPRKPLGVRVSGPFRHAPGVTAVIARSFVLSR
jgi:NAD(P)-dependent dehydrogenase (short-subunit alcohol dehydrogenase family)